MVEAVHSKKYLKRLHSSPSMVARIVELPPLAILPMCLIDRLLLKKLRIQAAGTILTVGLALKEGWGVNLGGGMHHASWDEGAGWCPYSDITMAIQQARSASRGAVNKVWVIDTDAHQGNGYARDKLHSADAQTIVIDLYNSGLTQHYIPHALCIYVYMQFAAVDGCIFSAAWNFFHRASFDIRICEQMFFQLMPRPGLQ